MAYKIGWTLQAVETFDKIIKYLETEWTKREIENFVIAVDSRLKLIAERPKI